MIQTVKKLLVHLLFALGTFIMIWGVFNVLIGAYGGVLRGSSLMSVAAMIAIGYGFIYASRYLDRLK